MRGNKIKWAPGLLLRTEDWNANVWDLRSDSMLKIASVIGELKKGDFVIFLGEATLSKVWNTWEIKVFTRFGVGWAEAQRFMWDGITSAAFNRGLDEFRVGEENSFHLLEKNSDSNLKFEIVKSRDRMRRDA